MPFFWQRPRPMHLGRFPMEKIKRVKETTTKISDDIPRIPKRAHFFQRAHFGDLGPEPRPTNTNQRYLQLKRPIPKDKIIPIYPVEIIRPPGSHEPHPLDRQDAQARAAKK